LVPGKSPQYLLFLKLLLRRESHITRTPPPPTRVSARMQNDTVEVTFNGGSAFSPLSSCQVNISRDRESKWHALPSVTPHCKAKECSVVAPFKFFPCSTYQYSIRCDVSVDLDPTAIQSIRSLLNPVHFFAANHVREAIHKKEDFVAQNVKGEGKQPHFHIRLELDQNSKLALPHHRSSNDLMNQIFFCTFQALPPSTSYWWLC